MIPLEQNYRSTNAILNAANGVIAHNRERKEKNLWSELGEGEPVRVIEVEDEHAEARFVAAEVAGLVEEGYRASARSRSSTGRTRRAACSRTCSSARAIAYQVIGGPRFYERAEIKDAIAYLQVIDNPYDAVSLTRIANRPRRGVGDTTLARLQARADRREISLWEALGRAEAGRCRRRSLKALKAFRGMIAVAQAAAQELEVPELVEEVLGAAVHGIARGRAHDRATRTGRRR